MRVSEIKLGLDGRSVGRMERVPVIVEVLLMELFRRRIVKWTSKSVLYYC